MISRIKASLVHASISFLVACLAVTWIFLVLHPAPLAKAIGVGEIFWVVIAVDVVLGPILTFAVYKTGKKSLKFDLAIIGCMQVCALSYGLWTIASARPAWLVLNSDRFDVAQADELDQRRIDNAWPDYRSASWSGPRWVASRAPTDLAKRNELILESTAGGPDLPQRIDLYVPLSAETDRLRTKSHPLQELKEFNSSENIHAELAKWPQADGWLPLMARAKPMVVLIDKAAARPLAIVDLRPWS